MANTQDAILLATLLEPIAVKHGFHIAVGGGTINKTGDRKDIDILVYRRRDAKHKNACSPLNALFSDMSGVRFISDVSNLEMERWCTKAIWHGIPVDFLFPESPAGEYDGSINPVNETIELADEWLQLHDTVI